LLEYGEIAINPFYTVLLVVLKSPKAKAALTDGTVPTVALALWPTIFWTFCLV